MTSAFLIQHATEICRKGGVIAYPTEAVFGLGCDPLNERAVHHLCQLKQRDINKGLIILASSIQQLADYIQPMSEEDAAKITKYSTPTSWIVPVLPGTPKWLTGRHDCLVIRITTHPVVQNLCHHLGHPLVSSSANPGGNKPALNALQLHRYFHNELDAILVSGKTSSGQPSTIRRLHDESLVRN